jgi:hypothetical protein
MATHSSRDGAGEPAFEGQRPPFSNGNAEAIRHGGYSAARLAPLATEIEAKIRELVPDASDAAAVGILASNLARIRLVNDWLAEQGIFRGASEEGVPQPVLRDLTRWERVALSTCDKLGLTRSSRAQLGLTLAETDAVEALRVVAFLPQILGALLTHVVAMDYVPASSPERALADLRGELAPFEEQLKALPAGEIEYTGGGP